MFWPFKKYDVEMSPEVHGVITLEGVPQEGMTVVRELFYEGYKKGKTVVDETQTNEQAGVFFFLYDHSLEAARKYFWRKLKSLSTN